MENQRNTDQRCGPQRLWERTASRFVHAVERVFFLLGVLVARKPWQTVVLTFFFIAVSSLGYMRFHLEKNPMKLWIPPESDFYRDTDWYMQNFGIGFRLQTILLTADNVLEQNVLLKLGEINEKVQSIQVTQIEDSNAKSKNVSLKDLCYKVAKIDIQLSGIDPSFFVPFETVCETIKMFKSVCYHKNILDLWSNHKDTIYNLTREEISRAVDTTVHSPHTGHPMNFSTLLGEVKRDPEGKIVSAKSLLTTWFVHVNFTGVDLDKVGNLVGTEDWVSSTTLLWESKFLDLMKTFAKEEEIIKIYYQAGRSYGDISGATMFQEMDKLSIGIALMFIYIQIIMSGFNCLEIRLMLGSVSLMCVGLAYFTACSWCSIFGIPYGPVHASLPFLLMGLGIDDMFVMKACWEQLNEEQKGKPLSVQVGLMLQHAGVSIVITSFTDIVAFLIGSITILPSLRSFCFYAAVGVFFIFCFSVTFYVAVFTLDARRISANRNGLFFCYKHKEHIQLDQRKTLFQRWFGLFYSNFIFTVPMKVIIITFTIVMSAFSMEAVLRLEQRFDPDWFIPADTYLKQFLDKHKFYYPNDGQFGFVFFGQMNYTEELPHLYETAQRLREESYITGLTTWVEGLHNYVSENYVKNFAYSKPSDDEFNEYLLKYLFSLTGGQFHQNFVFSDNLTCERPTPTFTASSFQFSFQRFSGPYEYIPAMNKLKEIIKLANITTGDGYRSVWSKIFANWVTDEIIGVEVERNVELALLCVMACTVFLITDLQMCLWIFVCVLLTLVNVCGWMQRWGMTVDIVSCIGLELAIGLCVDYAAHVGHTFLTIPDGNRKQRSFKTVTSIGTAVLYGGGSTLLSLSVLSMSKSYTFSAFFKIFLLVILFGLFHGLIFLPVVLSLIGPRPYHKKPKEEITSSKEMEGLNVNDLNLQETNGYDE